MPRVHPVAGWVSARASLWFGMGSVFVLVAVLAGPRALANLSARWRQPAASQRPDGSVDPAGASAPAPAAGGSSVVVDLGRVGFATTPAWMQGDVALAVMESLNTALVGSLDMMDDAGALALRGRLQVDPWVRSVGLKRRYPDRFALDLELRRPELAVRTAVPAATEAASEPVSQTLAIIDRDGVVLPLRVIPPGLPWTFLEEPHAFPAAGGESSRPPVGEPFPDDRIVAAAAVAAEVRRELRTQCPAMPALAGVDANNLDYRFVAGRGFSEVRIALRSADDRLVWLAFGHPPASDAPRVPVATKAEVLRQILIERPGLAGVVRGDLRFANRWRDWLVAADASAPR